LSDILFHAKVEVDSHVSKKNNRPIHARGRKRFIGKSQKLVSAEKHLQFEILNALNKAKIYEPIEGEIHAMYHFHFGPDKRRSYALTDLSNLFEIVSDSLQTSKGFRGAIKNDRQIKSFDGSRKFLNSSTYLEIFLMTFTEKTDLVNIKETKRRG
jgi:Holliday junction resolvase RusA-like endonuclease